MTVPETVTWVGVDVPAVVDLRRSLLPDDATTLIGASLDDPHWADDIDAAGRPVLVLTEGVLMYLDDTGLTTFLTSTRERFGAGTALVADYFHPRIALSGRHPIVKATGAQFRSGARHGRALAERAPGWTLEAEHEVMGRISPVHRAVAATFRTLSGGGRAYSVAVLRAV